MANLPGQPPIIILPGSPVYVTAPQVTKDTTTDLLYAIYKALGGTLQYQSPIMANNIPEIHRDRGDDILDAILQLISGNTLGMGGGGTRLVYGNVAWLHDLVFNVSPCEYYILDVLHNSPQTQITLDPADATNPRIDVIYVNAAGVVGKITGVPAPSPQKPLVNPATQLELTFVAIAAGATVPTNFVNEDIYHENIEWQTVGNDPVEFDNTADPQDGLKSIFANYFYSLIFSFHKGSSLQAADYTMLRFYLKLTDQDPATIAQRHLRVAFMSGANVVNGNYVLGTADGFDANLFNVWQLITIPFSQMAWSSGSFDTLLFRSDMNAKFRMDNIVLQGAPHVCCGGSGGGASPNTFNSQLGNPFALGVDEDTDGDGRVTLTKL